MRKAFFFFLMVVCMFLISAGILAVVSAFMLKGHMTTGFVSGGVIAAYVISCLVGGFCVGQYMGKHKFLWGTLIGLFYFFILYLLGAILYSKGFQMSLQVFGSCLICIVSGMLGGMLAPAEKR